MNRTYIGIDLGGTNIAAALVDDDGAIVKKRSIPTPLGSDSIICAIEKLCLELMEDSVSSVGIGVPGTVWPRGHVSYACNINMRDVALADILFARLHRNVYVENDANCAALGEYLCGCGQGASSLLCVTIGTGVGGGFVENGRLFRGFNGCGVEIGHMVIDPAGEECACGRQGCFETYASTSALIQKMKEYLGRDDVDGRTVFAAMDSGDTGAYEIFNDYVCRLATGMTNLVNIFQPEVLCIGGGISAQGERLLGPVREILTREEYARDCALHTRLCTAQLGNDAGIIGAALLERTDKND